MRLSQRNKHHQLLSPDKETDMQIIQFFVFFWFSFFGFIQQLMKPNLITLFSNSVLLFFVKLYEKAFLFFVLHFSHRLSSSLPLMPYMNSHLIIITKSVENKSHSNLSTQSIHSGWYVHISSLNINTPNKSTVPILIPLVFASNQPSVQPSVRANKWNGKKDQTKSMIHNPCILLLQL